MSSLIHYERALNSKKLVSFPELEKRKIASSIQPNVFSTLERISTDVKQIKHTEANRSRMAAPQPTPAKTTLRPKWLEEAVQSFNLKKQLPSAARVRRRKSKQPIGPDEALEGWEQRSGELWHYED